MAPETGTVSSHCPSPRSSSSPRLLILATPPGMDPSELKRVFQMFDRNGDGCIMKKELSDSLENLGIYIPEADLESMIEKINVNRDGCADIEEFGSLYRQSWTRRRTCERRSTCLTRMGTGSSPWRSCGRCSHRSGSSRGELSRTARR